MTTTRSSFADAMAPGFRQIFMDALKWGEKPPTVNMVYNTPNTPDTQYIDDSYVTGFGLVPTKGEGSPSSYDDIYQGLDTRYTHDTYSLAYRVTKEWVEDERYQLMAKLPKALGRSMRATVETDGANMLNNGFTTTGYNLGPGNTYLFRTDHSFVTGGTQGNRSSTNVDLSPTSWEQAQIDLKDTTDDRGIFLGLEPAKLVHPNELNWMVDQMFNSPGLYDSANRTTNPMRNDNLDLVEWSYLTDPDAWFVFCTEHEANWFWRIMPDHYQGNDFDTDDAKFKVRARWKRGVSAYWGLYGSPGG